MLIMSNIGDQVWLMTSRQTEPLLLVRKGLVICLFGWHFGQRKLWKKEEGEKKRGECTAHRCLGGRCGSRSRCWGFCRGTGPGARRGLSRVRRRMVLGGVSVVQRGNGS